jgi:hypothetical protein
MFRKITLNPYSGQPEPFYLLTKFPNTLKTEGYTRRVYMAIERIAQGYEFIESHFHAEGFFRGESKT